MLGKLGMKEGEAIVHPWVNKALEKAQGKVEARNFDIRKNLLKFDDVMNDQRKAIFAQRREIMEAADVAEVARDMRHQVVDDLVDEHVPPKAYADQWDIDGLAREVKAVFGTEPPLQAWADEEGVDDEAIRERLLGATDELMAGKVARYGVETMRSGREAGAAADHRRRTGASTSSPSTTCAASSASAATPSATR